MCLIITWYCLHEKQQKHESYYLTWICYWRISLHYTTFNLTGHDRALLWLDKVRTFILHLASKLGSTEKVFILQTTFSNKLSFSYKFVIVLKFSRSSNQIRNVPNPSLLFGHLKSSLIPASSSMKKQEKGLKSAPLFSPCKICLRIYFTLFRKTINKHVIHCDGNYCKKEPLTKNSIIIVLFNENNKMYNRLTEVTISIIKKV